MSFPTTLDDFTNPAPATPTNSTTIPLSTAISQLNDAVEAIQARIGITGSQVSGTIEKRVSDLQTNTGTVTANLGIHEAAADPHTQYLLETDPSRIPTFLMTLQGILYNSDADVQFLFISDSTGDDSTEFIRSFVETYVAPAFPTCRVNYIPFNSVSNNYLIWQQAINTGTEPYVTVSATDGRGWAVDPDLVGTEGTELELRVDCAMDDWGSDALDQTFISRYGSAGHISWRLYSAYGGTLKFEWSVDGTNLTTATCSVTYGLSAWANNSRRRVGVTLKCDNGSGGYEVKFYASSVDNSSYSQVGNTIVGGATTSIYNAANQTVEIGSRGATNAAVTAGNTMFGAGKFYSAYCASTIGGANRLPVFIREWNAPYGSLGTRNGGPQISVYNASVGGTNLTAHAVQDTAERQISRSRMAFVWIASSHNEITASHDKTFIDALDLEMQRVAARIRYPLFTLCTQNPLYSPITEDKMQSQRARNILLHAKCAYSRLCMADIYNAYGTNRALVATDGMHPLAAGSVIGAAALARAFGFSVA